jgi:hypothetical protein
MKKIIKRFWGVAFVVVLLSTLFVGALPQAAAANYAFGGDVTQPTINNGILAPVAGFGFTDVAQSGLTVVAIGNAVGSEHRIYRSTNGGATWARINSQTAPGGGYWSYVAIAPDDPNIIAVVDTNGATDTVYLSNNAGVTFSAANTLMPAGAYIKGISISPIYNGVHIMTIVGNNENRLMPLGVNNGFLLNWSIGAVAPGWAVIANAPTFHDGIAVAYSPYFSADQALLVVTQNVTTQTVAATNLRGRTTLHVYSYNINNWDAAVDPTWPRQMALGNTTVGSDGFFTQNITGCQQAKIALDPNFYMGDAAAQIGFVAASITDNSTVGGAQLGGVFRISTYAVSGGIYSLTDIYPDVVMDSIAWDGTNLMASQNVTTGTPIWTTGTPIWRTAGALGVSPTFNVSSTVKAPATGNNTVVFFNSGVGYAASNGPNGGIAKTTDNGATFNGVALINSNFNTMEDFWISPDGAREYALVDDTVDLNLWRKSGTAWERVFILATGTFGTTAGGAGWMVRADADVPDTVFLGKFGAVNMFKALDAGEHTWAPRSCSALIQDFAVQDANTIYVAVNAGTTVVKSITGAFTWLTPMATGFAAGGVGDTCYSLNLLADNQLIVGGNAGWVSYSADGATWNLIPAPVVAGAGSVVATANGLATGSTIWAADTAAGGATANIALWIIGTNSALNPWTSNAGLLPAPTTADGIAYANGVLYVYDDTVGSLYRYLYPNAGAWGLTLGIDCVTPTALVFAGANTINAIQAITDGTVNTVLGRDATNPDTVFGYTDYLTQATNAPVPVYPINGAKIDVNSINGNVQDFAFRWNCPPAISTLVRYNFDIFVYLDEAGTIVVGADGPIGGAFGGATSAITAGAILVLPFAPVPGTTYYWQVGVSAASPVQSYLSPVQTFSIQQLTAIVPIVQSPASGATGVSTTPAFSWTPISGATSYHFELATDAAFTHIVYTVDPSSAGAGVPASAPLTAGGQYYWRVKALTPNEGEYSSVANFVVATPVAPILPTQSPEIGSPVNGSSVDSVTPGFSWAPITGATKYRFELSKDAAFATVLYTVDTTAAGAAVPSANALSRGTMYFWRVKAIAPADGAWSTVANFLVALPPATSAAPVTITQTAGPTIILTQTQPAQTTTQIVQEEKVVNPTYIWAIIIIGAILVIAVIVLIVRTRRSV